MSANRIKILRVKKNLSQEELAKKVHVTQTAVSQWEKERTKPDTETAIKLAELFEVTVDYLLGRTDSTYAVNSIQSMHYSPVTQNIGFSANEIKKGNEHNVEENELLKIFRFLNAKQRHKLMSIAFELEDELKLNKEENASKNEEKPSP